jgi:hypothetical protein
VWSSGRWVRLALLSLKKVHKVLTRAHLLFPNNTKEGFFRVSFFRFTNHEGHRSRDVIFHSELDVSSLERP